MRMRSVLATLVLVAGAAQPLMARDLALVLSNSDTRRDWYSRGTGGYGAMLTALEKSGFELATFENVSATEGQRAVSDLREHIADYDRVLVVLNGAVVSTGWDSWLLAEGATDADPVTIGGQGVSVAAVADAISDRQGRALLVIARDTAPTRVDAALRTGQTGLVPPQGVTLIEGPSRLTFGMVTDFVENADTVDLRAAVAATAGRVQGAGYLPDHPSFGTDDAVVQSAGPEAEFWRAARVIDTREAYQAFLSRYPNSAYEPDARAALQAISDRLEGELRSREQALNLSRDNRVRVQEGLTHLGYNTRGVDGIFGRGTRTAISNWQGDAGFEPSGYLTGLQVAMLMDAADDADAAKAEADKDARAADREYWITTGQGETRDGLQKYLKQFPNGIYAEDARAKLAAMDTPAQTEEPPAEEEETPTGEEWEAIVTAAREQEDSVLGNPVARLLVEQRLTQLGYKAGVIDGRFDDKTREALKAFQAERDIAATGYVTRATAAQLLSN